MILHGNKIGAIAAIRKELSCSLSEAKAIADTFDHDLGTLSKENQEPNEPIEASYSTPWVFHLISLFISKNSWGIPKALRLAKKYRINVDYHILGAHARAGGNPNLVINEMCNAIKSGSQPDLMKLMAADLVLLSEQKFKSWVQGGMSEPVDPANASNAASVNLNQSARIR